MANANSPTGLRPVAYMGGAPYNGAANLYIATDSNALFIGDPVVKAGSASADGIPTCTIATNGATNAITGVVVGFQDKASMELGYGAGSTTRQVLVADDPNLLFEVQEDSGGATTALNDIGLNVDLISAAGSTTKRISQWQVDSSTKAVGATLQCKLRGFAQRPDNTPASANAKVLVSINLHTETPGVVGL